MSQVILLGNPKTKRTIYLEKAARKTGIPVFLANWRDFQGDFLQGETELFLKIDPPVWNHCCLEELNYLVERYKADLETLAVLRKKQNISFLNTPETILELLNKQTCKRKLQKNGLPVTEELEIYRQEYGQELSGESMSNGFWKAQLSEQELAELLIEAMVRQNMPQVFIKPILGSGAAGVAAFRCQPKKGEVVLYTCAMEDPATGRLVNTKRLRRFTDRKQVLSMAGKLLRLGCVVERWYAKAEYDTFSYDLRVVIQDGQVDFLLARLSSGPITNLHLNNHPLKAEELGLKPQVLASVKELCCQAVQCYSGLRSAGIDILLEKGSLRPRIIEMNGQGDLIYQDIYNKNVIYCHQAEMMKEWLWKHSR